MSQVQFEPFTTAIQWLTQHNIPYKRKTAYQIKIGKNVSFFTTGKIHVDGEQKARPNTGFVALKAVLFEMGLWKAPFEIHLVSTNEFVEGAT
jgi:hypothetical protein